MPKRTLAIGDIHGCDVALELLLNHLQPTLEDTVVVLGDVVDRGPGSKRCVEMLIELQNKCNLVFLMGNHEEMMLDAVNGGEWSQGWLRYGGTETLRSYGCKIRHLPQEHLAFLAAGYDFLETSNSIFIHANMQMNLPLDEQPRQWLRWVHLTGYEKPHPTGKRIVCGHTRQSSGLPATLNGWVCIDTFACGGGYLTCLDTKNDLVYRTTQTGEIEVDIPLADLAVPFEPD